MSSKISAQQKRVRVSIFTWRNRDLWEIPFFVCCPMNSCEGIWCTFAQIQATPKQYIKFIKSILERKFVAILKDEEKLNFFHRKINKLFLLIFWHELCAFLICKINIFTFFYSRHFFWKMTTLMFDGCTKVDLNKHLKIFHAYPYCPWKELYKKKLDMQECFQGSTREKIFFSWLTFFSLEQDFRVVLMSFS